MTKIATNLVLPILVYASLHFVTIVMEEGFAEQKFSPSHHLKKWQSFVFDHNMLNINIY